MAARSFRRTWQVVFSAFLVAVLLGLGTWQVYRLTWKSRILADIAAAEAGDPIPLARATPYAKVTLTGRPRADLTAFYGVEVRDTQTGPTMGAHLLVPLERAGEPPVLVDLGWVPGSWHARTDPGEAPVTIVGYARPPDVAGLFSAADDPGTRHFYTLNPPVIAAALGLPAVAPFSVVALGDAPAGRWPDPVRTLPRPPNNHLMYAITWYGLALAMVVISFVWIREKR